MVSDHAHCVHLWQYTKLVTDRKTCESPKFRAIQTEKGGEYPESKSALESKQESPCLFTPPSQLPPPLLLPDPCFREFLRREASKQPTPCQDQRFGNWSPGSAERSASLR